MIIAEFFDGLILTDTTLVANTNKVVPDIEQELFTERVVSVNKLMSDIDYNFNTRTRKLQNFFKSKYPKDYDPNNHFCSLQLFMLHSIRVEYLINFSSQELNVKDSIDTETKEKIIQLSGNGCRKEPDGKVVFNINNSNSLEDILEKNRKRTIGGLCIRSNYEVRPYVLDLIELIIKQKSSVCDILIEVDLLNIDLIFEIKSKFIGYVKYIVTENKFIVLSRI